MKLVTIVAAGTLAFSTAAYAAGHTQKDKAQNMRDLLQSGTFAPNASVPAKNTKGGWGNLVGPATTTNGAKSLTDDAK